MMVGLIAYFYMPKRPPINVEFEPDAQMFLPFCYIELELKKRCGETV